MGCNMQKNIPIKIISKIYLDNNTSFSININKHSLFKFKISNNNLISNVNKNKNYNNILTSKQWQNIIDYLSFTDLKEVGKINRKFNNFCKCSKILIKFFKKIEEKSIYVESKNSFDSFSQLQIKINDINKIL